MPPKSGGIFRFPPDTIALVIIIGNIMESNQKPSLADKLKSLGVKKGEFDIPASKQKTGASIQDVLSGDFVSTRRGETFIHEEIYEADYRHGWAPLETDAPLTLMAAWAKFMPYRQLLLSNISVCGELRYLGIESSSTLAPKPTMCPLMSCMGKINRLRNRS